MKKTERTGRALSKANGVITVFFTLLSVLFLSLLFMLIESARFQGARAQCANIVDMGSMSLFGEYEQKLLTDFEVFAVDGAYGTGDFSLQRVSDRLKTYLNINAEPAGTSIVSGAFFDPWCVSLEKSSIQKYTLLSDSGGEGFYQQAVAYMRETVLMQAAGKLMEYYRDAQEAEKMQKAYQEEEKSLDSDMDALEKEEKEAKQRQEEQSAKEGASEDPLIYDPGETGQETEKQKIRNPLAAIRRLRRKDILSIVCGDSPISDRSVKRGTLPSKRRLKRGNLPVKRTYSGLLNHLLYREYLLDHFSSWSKTREGTDFAYELEYILAGKTTDRKNLKSVVKKLLLLRSGVNYLYCVKDMSMNGEAESLAALIIGWTGIPELVSIMKHALLIAWSYGESLLDVRTLMRGGRVPLVKHSGDWELSLEKLADINEMLRDGRRSQSSGLDYKEHLRILLNLQGVGDQKMRGLDLVELSIRKGAGLSNFRVDHCLVAVQSESSFRIPPLFSRVSSLWMGIRGGAQSVSVRGGYAY